MTLPGASAVAQGVRQDVLRLDLPENWQPVALQPDGDSGSLFAAVQVAVDPPRGAPCGAVESVRIVAALVVTMTAVCDGNKPHVVAEGVLLSLGRGALAGDPERPAVLVRSAVETGEPDQTQVLWLVGGGTGTDRSGLLGCLSISRVAPGCDGSRTDDPGLALAVAASLRWVRTTAGRTHEVSVA